MLWSTGGEKGYTMGFARSVNGDVLGPWIQDASPLFEDDGGHGMIFKDFDGKLRLIIHAPNLHPLERPTIISFELSS